ncbi:MAG: hypothetical protein AB1815_08980 [Bacillota bacterium]
MKFIIILINICHDLNGTPLTTELIRPKTPASVGGGFQRAVKSSMDSANIQRGLNPPLNVSRVQCTASAKPKSLPDF